MQEQLVHSVVLTGMEFQWRQLQVFFYCTIDPGCVSENGPYEGYNLVQVPTKALIVRSSSINILSWAGAIGITEDFTKPT